jgi:Double zinc ribbon
MAPIALFGIENGGLNLAVNLLVLALVVVWAALVYWTYSDARRRITDPMLVGCATAASLFPFIGTIVYLIVRPPEYLDDVHERDLEIAAAEARLNSVRQQTCPHCDFEIEASLLRCPSCLRRLKEPCTVCGKPLDPRWKICPYCEAEVGQAPAQPRRRERRVRPASGQGRPAQGQPQPQEQQRQSSQGQPSQGQQQHPAQPQPNRQQAAPQRQTQRPPRDGGGTAERPATRPPAG